MLYVDQELDAIHRIRYVGNPANQAPTAVAAADKVSGPAPLTVRLDGTKSTDPDLRDAFSYAWDLDGDGQYDDSNNAKPKLTLRRPGTATVCRAGHRHGRPVQHQLAGHRDHRAGHDADVHQHGGRPRREEPPEHQLRHRRQAPDGR